MGGCGRMWADVGRCGGGCGSMWVDGVSVGLIFLFIYAGGHAKIWNEMESTNNNQLSLKRR